LVGELLKKAREESGKDIKEISAVLKIRYEYLRAIEEGDFKNLPEEVYIKGYIREYAEFLHIDPETALNAYMQQTSPPADTAGEPYTKVTSDHKKIKTTYILIPFIVVIFGLLLYAFLHSPQEEQKMPEVSVETTDVMPPPVIEPPEEMTEVPAETKEEVASALPETGQEILTPHVDTVKETPPESERAKKPVVKTVTPPHTLKVVTTEIVWLLITADDADPQEMTLQPGETVSFQAHEGFSLKLGNAGGAQVILNGKDLGKLGEKGQVVNLNLPEKLD
jgi:cytoskeletal protein RodZ